MSGSVGLGKNSMGRFEASLGDARRAGRDGRLRLALGRPSRILHQTLGALDRYLHAQVLQLDEAARPGGRELARSRVPPPLGSLRTGR
jgi:hypothetical protein